MQKLKFFSDYIMQRYGKKLYRIPVDLSLGCPNRENRFGAGCIFCAENGSRARHLSRNLNLAEQIKSGIEFVRTRYQAEAPYIAYFQAFTSTYAPVKKLRELYEEVLKQADFKVIIVSTRPDALPPEVVDYLAELSQRYELWVELGVQTAVESTLLTINRGHTFEQTCRAVQLLAAKNLNIAAHLIVGLPGEETADFLYTAKQVAALPFKAVKIHQLLVLKHTELAARYGADNSYVLPQNEYTYADNLRQILTALPDDMLLMRLTADADADSIIAPKWWMNKGQFLEFFQREFSAPSLFPAQSTADGSRTLYHPRYKQHFHSLAGADSEARMKFVAAGTLTEHLQKYSKAEILDVGFGLGGNSFAALEAAGQSCAKLNITALELDKRVLPAAQSLHAADSVEAKILHSLNEYEHYESPSGAITLLLGDARQTVAALPDSAKFDYIFLDGFSSDVNPELWSFDFLRLLCRHLTPAGQLITYSSAYPVRGALLRCGMTVKETSPFGRKRGGTIASLHDFPSAYPLPDKELDIIMRSTAGTPLRDYQLNWNSEKILAHHARIVAKLRNKGVPKWFKNKK